MDTGRLALIRRWSMDGAHDDLNRRFESPVDIHAVVADLDDEPRSEVAPRPATAPVLMRPAGGDDWRPLVIEPSPA